ncbi:4-hydroxybenzoate 3-monooxygenase [Xylanimonas ulmi]
MGGGPAGLLLSRLLRRDGVDHVVLETRTREQIEATHRAGILEAGAVDALVEAGIDRVLRDGDEHEGITLRFDGESHRIDLAGLTGRTVWLYPQTDVFTDLAERAQADGADVRWQATVTQVLDRDTASPGVRWTDAEGHEHELRADLLVGADGSRSVLRHTLSEQERHTFSHEYPYAWYGFIVQAPRSAPELVYTASEHGFALLSQRTPTHQRMYFQCDPDEDPAAWDDARVWETMRARVAGPDGFAVAEGPIVERSVLRFRSAVVEPVRHGRSLLVGDAAHTVPPTGAKGLNLAIADVVVLHDVLTGWLRTGDDDALDEYGRRVGERVWRAQHFSAWMSRMLHSAAGETPFEARRRVAELRTLCASEAGRRYLAEGYTGWGPITTRKERP